MTEIFFPNTDEILLVHAKIIEETGGSHGLRDAGVLESAMKAAENRLYYETAGLAILGATYAYHLTQAHAFVDGNKRIGAVVSELFLEMNDAKSTATNDEIIELFLDIAASRLSREDVERKFANWLVLTEKTNE